MKSTPIYAALVAAIPSTIAQLSLPWSNSTANSTALTVNSTALTVNSTSFTVNSTALTVNSTAPTVVNYGADSRELSQSLQDTITTEGLFSNLRRLEAIAMANGGNRAFGHPGYAASRDFVVAKVNNSRGWNAWVQDFPANYTNVDSISLEISGVKIPVVGPSFSPSTPVEGVTLPLVLGPPKNASCTKEGYNGLDVKDKIVLVQRGACPDKSTLASRVRAAGAAGANSIIIYNNVPQNATSSTLTKPDPRYIPTGYINMDVGEGLKKALEKGQDIEAYFQHSQTIKEIITQNVFVESIAGDPHNVVMIGAHLDSVKAGPGINDNGSGVSLLLEIYEGLQSMSNFTNKVRFAFWGAEEVGLRGSRHFVNQVKNTTEADSILAYLNLDMVGRGFWGVLDFDGSKHGKKGPAGSEVIEALLTESLVAQGKNVTEAPISGGSDYRLFYQILKKPVGGLFTGSAAAQDDCYHKACDTVRNVVPEIITANAKSAAHALSVLAMEGQALLGGDARKVQQRDLSAMSVDDDSMWSVAPGEKHVNCGGVS